MQAARSPEPCEGIIMCCVSLSLLHARRPDQDAHARFRLDLERARAEGFRMGAKLVRGAYMLHERERAAQKGYPSPVWDTIEETHACYDRRARPTAACSFGGSCAAPCGGHVPPFFFPMCPSQHETVIYSCAVRAGWCRRPSMQCSTTGQSS